MAKQEKDEVELMTKGTKAKNLKLIETEGVKTLVALRDKYFLIFGVVLGLIFGTLGDFLAGHWIEILRVVAVYEWWWAINIVAFLFFLLAISISFVWAVRLMRHIQDNHELVEILLNESKELQKEDD